MPPQPILPLAIGTVLLACGPTDEADIVVAGVRRAEGDDDPPIEAFVGHVDPSTWHLIDAHVESDFARVGAVALAEGRIHALLSPAGIDYSDRSLVAFDDGGAAWVRQVGIDADVGNTDPYVTAIVAVGQEVVTFDHRPGARSVARFDDDGHERWRHIEADEVDALEGVRTADHLVEVVLPVAWYTDPIARPPRATVRSLEGEKVCAVDLDDEAEIEALGVGADPDGDTVVTVTRSDDQTLAITARALGGR